MIVRRLLCSILIFVATVGFSTNTPIVSFSDAQNHAIRMPSSLPSKQQVRALLERWCIEYYDVCFSGRYYIQNSLTVTSIEEDESTGYLKVRGKHSFKGYRYRIGGQRDFPDVDYRATIMPSSDGQGITVRFLKWKVPYLPLQTGEWEVGEKSIVIR